MARVAGLLFLAWLALAAGCSSETIAWYTKCTPCELENGPAAFRVVPVLQAVPLAQAEAGAIAEQDLLDVDIRRLAPWQPDELERMTVPDGEPLDALRQAESYYLGQVLADTLQRSGHWGRVRLNPFGLSGADLEISGKVDQSDGQVMRVHLEARDSSGTLWLTRQYAQQLPAVERSGLEELSFQFDSLFNAFANDLAAIRDTRMTGDTLASLRANSLLKFATELAPAVYAPYRQENSLLRLPAQNDPVFVHMQQMRMRNETFLDAMQTSQELYVARIAREYLLFLDRSRQVTHQINEYFMEASANRVRRTGTLVARPANMNMGRFRGLYSQALAQINQPLEEAVTPLTLEFSDRTAQLSGSIEDQFAQWGTILLEMYELDTGAAVPAPDAPRD